MGDDFIVDGLNELIRQLTRERDEARAERDRAVKGFV